MHKCFTICRNALFENVITFSINRHFFNFCRKANSIYHQMRVPITLRATLSTQMEQSGAKTLCQALSSSLQCGSIHQPLKWTDNPLWSVANEHIIVKFIGLQHRDRKTKEPNLWGTQTLQTHTCTRMHTVALNAHATYAIIHSRPGPEQSENEFHDTIFSVRIIRPM